MKTFKVRFLNPVLPSDELTFLSQQNGDEINVEVKNQKDKRVLKGQAIIK